MLRAVISGGDYCYRTPRKLSEKLPHALRMRDRILRLRAARVKMWLAMRVGSVVE